VRHPTTSRTLLALLALTTAAGIATVGSGCIASGTHSSAGIVRISESDFKIAAPRRLSAGDAVLRVRNRGPDAHELIVIKLGPRGLPFRADGMTVDEEALERDELGALEPGEPESIRDLDVRLAPGRYVLLCNMSGHYLGGMHRTLVVR
jgi:uncharacterized cupredoxin-like copper-binding protein